MKISDQLNLVIPLYRDEADEAPYAYVHSVPISEAAFDVHFKLLIKAFEAMIAIGASAMGSARRFVIAAAEEMTSAGGRADLLWAPLLNEIERMSIVLVSTPTGWDTVPLRQAVDQGFLEPGDDTEAVNGAVFFTVAWHVPPRRRRSLVIEYGATQWSAVTSSLTPTDFIASLKTSTAVETSAATAPSGTPPAAATQTIAGQSVSLTV